MPNMDPDSKKLFMDFCNEIINAGYETKYHKTEHYIHFIYIDHIESMIDGFTDYEKGTITLYDMEDLLIDSDILAIAALKNNVKIMNIILTSLSEERRGDMIRERGEFALLLASQEEICKYSFSQKNLVNKDKVIYRLLEEIDQRDIIGFVSSDSYFIFKNILARSSTDLIDTLLDICGGKSLNTIEHGIDTLVGIFGNKRLNIIKHGHEYKFFEIVIRNGNLSALARLAYEIDDPALLRDTLVKTKEEIKESPNNNIIDLDQYIDSPELLLDLGKKHKELRKKGLTHSQIDEIILYAKNISPFIQTCKDPKNALANIGTDSSNAISAYPANRISNYIGYGNYSNNSNLTNIVREKIYDAMKFDQNTFSKKLSQAVSTNIRKEIVFLERLQNEIENDIKTYRR